jgi:hypothetical protein
MMMAYFDQHQFMMTIGRLQDECYMSIMDKIEKKLWGPYCIDDHIPSL